MTRIFVLIDALGWEYVKNRDFLPDILTHRAEVQTVLGFSSGAIPTLLSGKQPRESGHWNLFYYDPKNSPFGWVRHFSCLPVSFLNNRVVRRVVRLVSQHISQFGGYFQIYGVPVELLPYFDICEKRDIYKPGGVPGSIFDQWERSGLRFRTYSYHELSDEEIIRCARHDLKMRKFDLYFVYLAEMDAFLHHSCADEQQVEKQIRRYESWLRELYLAAREVDEEITFVVFSDHGMTPKRAGYDLIEQIQTLDLRMPSDYLALYDSTMARFWFFNQRSLELIRSKLGEVGCGRILTLAEQQRFGIDFADNRYGDMIFLMDPGVLIEPSFMGSRAPDGMHGFDPEADRYASAAFFANRKPQRPIRTLIDIHSVMLDWVGPVAERVHVTG